MIATNEVFLDTAFAIALTTAADRHHGLAIDLANQLKANRVRLVTTRAILLEIGNYLSKRGQRTGAIQVLDGIEADESIIKLSITDELFLRALHLFKERPDKEWGLIDCVSFIVMEERGISQALTTDKHFEQAGFVALLKPE